MDQDSTERCEQIVALIRADDPAGQQALYEELGPGLRHFMLHHLRGEQDVEDKVHDAFVLVVTAIREGQLREPARLVGFIHTIARRQVASHIAQAIRHRAETVEIAGDLPARHIAPDQERRLIERQRMATAEKSLVGLAEVDRQILVRFYVQGQAADQICRELSLSATQFRLRKNRAKERFAALVRRSMKRDKLMSDFSMRRRSVWAH